MSARRKKTQGSGSTQEPSVDNVFGQYVLGDFRPSDLIDVAGELAKQARRQPGAVINAGLGFLKGIRSVVTGQSTQAPDPSDRRFSDPAWKDSKLFNGVLQGYLELRDALQAYAKESGLNENQVERAEFLMTQIADALAPTNFLPTNPAALRKARETRGASLWAGLKMFVDDVSKGRPIPSQVDESAFKVGENLAATPGSVVFRHDMFELLQYTAQTAQVRERPIFVVPSIVNKYYAFDIAPKRSVMEYFVQQGFTVYVMAWRNPKPEHDFWGMPDYIDAIDEGLDVALNISKSDSVNMWAVCGAGPLATSLVAHHQSVGQRKVNSLLLFVSPLDMAAMSNAPAIGAFVDKQAMPMVRKEMRKKRMSARQFTLLFAMLRANDLIWNYWVSNYLMGIKPTAFDILYWNGDGTGMTAQYNYDFTAFVENNPLVSDGEMLVRGKPVAPLADLDIDSYVLGAANDHLCIWQGVYRSAQMLGKRSQFVLGNSGHIQTIVCPPSNPKASYFLNDHLPATAGEWHKTATKHQGSWWDHCVAWTHERGGKLINAPKAEGNAKYPPIGAAPGTYIHDRV
ncbi:alpha/beta fold hydrolase [Stenotrophobium rhamnosiphilum]|uniref:Class II poly(R)-hydroxyalkanoic acid synthase n=1 Tax=Stenotrophobium rhamnosiphilum TaxID=2029166 RepID=A0A2T5MK04_9GAMM|nr:alpha/beta fold hydrolase [Stenotrophobium rhamnosiphilum]PTU32905.1 class II poly(R)-hydroxyalkanoic acid synthase [Stenotrophobium rhamnosiphilum]